MSTPSSITLTLDLNSLDELFNAPDLNPFSEREIDHLGEAGIERLHKLCQKGWPRWPRAVHLVLRLPAEQAGPERTAIAHQALQRYCAEQIQINQDMRHNTQQVSWRQLGMAFVLLLLSTVAIYFGFINPLGILSPFLGPLIAILIVFAGSVSIFDSIWSLLFDWLPFVLEIRTYERIAQAEVIIEGRDRSVTP